jgi:ketosteroid isomerase-like protein
MPPTDEVPLLLRRATDANSALLRGDIREYLTLVDHSTDYTLMAPFGGPPMRGFDYSDGRLAELRRFFRSGEGELELVRSYASGDLVVLVLIEHQHAAVGDLQDQDWSLRVTQVYRREGADWRLVHRHADPLVQGISLERAAALARGYSR